MSKVHSFAGCLKAEFLRLILSPKTYLSVLLVAFAFGLSVRISGFDISWGDGVYFLGLAMNQSNTHLLLILSVGISFSTAFLEDWKHRYTLAQVIRAGTGSYAGARVIVCFVGAWTAAFLGIHLFLGLISLKIPVMSETFYEMYAYAPYGALAYSRFPYLYVLVIAAIISAGLAFWAVAGCSGRPAGDAFFLYHGVCRGSAAAGKSVLNGKVWKCGIWTLGQFPLYPLFLSGPDSAYGCFFL